MQLLGVGMVLLALVTATRPARNRAAVRRAALTPEPSLEELTAEATLELERST